MSRAYSRGHERARTWAPVRGAQVPTERSSAGGHCPELALRRLGGPLEIALAERVEMRATQEDLRGDLARHVLQEIRRDVREVRVEVRVVGGDAHPVGADEPGRGLDLRLAPLDRRPAVAPEVLARRHRQVRRVRVAVLRIVPLDPRQETRPPGVLGFQEADPELGMELEHAADDHRDQRLLHLDPVAGDVAVEPVLAVEVVEVRVPGPRALVEPPRHVELLVQAVERVPVVRVPEVAVHQIRPDERADRAELPHAPDELAGGQVHVVHRQHRDELQPLRAVLAELVDPVVVGLTERQRELGIEVVTGDERQPGRRVQHRDVDAFHRHAHHLSLGVVLAVDREIEPAGVGQPRAGQGLRTVRDTRAIALPVLLHLGVPRGGQTVDDDRPPPRPAVGAHLEQDTVLEPRVQVAIEEVHRLHDVHVAIDELQAVFHPVLLVPVLARLYRGGCYSQGYPREGGPPCASITTLVLRSVRSPAVPPARVTSGSPRQTARASWPTRRARASRRAPGWWSSRTCADCTRTTRSSPTASPRWAWTPSRSTSSRGRRRPTTAARASTSCPTCRRPSPTRSRPTSRRPSPT